MKKLLAVFLLFTLLVTAATAQGITWEQVEPMITTYELQGDFVTLDEVAVKIWIPSSMYAVELTEEDRAAGFIAYFVDENGVMQMSIAYVDMDGMDLTTYADQVTEYGAEEVDIEPINGLDAVTYKLPESDTLCVAFTTEAGYILEVAMGPLSVDGAEMGWGIIGASIQPV